MVYVLMILSLMYIMKNKNIKCRIYEDDYETSVYDLNNNIRRKILLTKVENVYSHIE